MARILCARTTTRAFPSRTARRCYDLLRLRNKIVENVPDAVLYPDTKEQIEQIVAYCAAKKIPVYVYGGGSSVTRGVECVRGGISLDLRLRFNKVIEFNEIDQSITVEAGMSGPKLEETLNNAVSLFGTKRAYTCGHFPQSFEYSSVGGWVWSRAAQGRTRPTTAAYRISCSRRNTQPQSA